MKSRIGSASKGIFCMKIPVKTESLHNNSLNVLIYCSFRWTDCLKTLNASDAILSLWFKAVAVYKADMPACSLQTKELFLH